MSANMKASSLVALARKIATEYKTLYVMGCFGSPLTAANKKRYTTNHTYNKQAARVKMINAASEDTFGFDCVNLMKGIVWGWSGDKSSQYGGAKYNSNGCPDYSANSMIKYCQDVSTTGWDTLYPGEALWIEGHFGIYLGDGLCAESTPKWKNGVQITAVSNVKKTTGYNCRKWTKHGKLPFIKYDTVRETPAEKEPEKTTTVDSAKTTTTTVGLAFNKGDTVKVKAGAKTYTGGSLAASVYSKTYEVIECGYSGRVVIGINGAVTAAVHSNDLEKVTLDISYTVAKGDTLSKIAAKYNTTYQKLADYNKLSNPNNIKVGLVIKIPQ